MKRLFPFLTMLFLLSAFSVYGESTLHIISSEGDQFSLVRGEIRRDYMNSDVNLTELSLAEGDYLMTGEGSFLELSSPDGDILLMLGENSSLSLDSLSYSQGSLVTLDYGHIHGLLSGGAGDFWVSGYDTVCRLEKGEFGYLLDYDMTLERPEIFSRIYSLEGSLEVMQRLEQPSESLDKRIEYKEPLKIEMGEMVIASSWEKDFALVPVLFDADYAGYWRKHPFSGMEPQTVMVIMTDDGGEDAPQEINPAVLEGDTLSEKEAHVESFIRFGQTNMVLGTAFLTGALVSYLNGMGNEGNMLLGVGAGWMAMGSGALVYSYFASPRLTEEE